MRSAFLLLALVSTAAFSCPELKGNYKNCRTNNPESSSIKQIIIKQKKVDRVEESTFNTDDRIEKYVADGKTKSTIERDAETGIAIETATTTSCDGKILKINMLALVDSEEFANITIETSKKGKQLTQVLTGVSMGEAVNETIICE